MIDTHGGVDAQAQVFIKILSEQRCEWQKNSSSFVIYNGRERWYGIEVWNDIFGKRLNVIFGESRNSDDFVVQWWISLCGTLNPPTIQDVPELSYRAQRKHFENCDFRGAKEFVLPLVTEWLLKESKS